MDGSTLTRLIIERWGEKCSYATDDRLCKVLEQRFMGIWQFCERHDVWFTESDIEIVLIQHQKEEEKEKAKQAAKANYTGAFKLITGQ